VNATLDMRKVRERTSKEMLSMFIGRMQALGTIYALLQYRKEKEKTK
jgi:hypothetical protein